MYLTCTFLGPFGVPAIYLGPHFHRSRPSHGGGPLTVAFHAWGGPEDPGVPWSLPRARFLPLPGGRAGVWRRQVPPLVSSACDSATRNAATAVVNNGASTSPAPPTPAR
jgi:hypothetical protein